MFSLSPFENILLTIKTCGANLSVCWQNPTSESASSGNYRSYNRPHYAVFLCHNIMVVVREGASARQFLYLVFAALRTIITLTAKKVDGLIYYRKLTMNKQLDRSKFTDNALRKIGLLPALPPRKIGIGYIVAVSTVSDDKPLYVCFENGVIFALGGLTTMQKNQIPHLLPELIGTHVFFLYDTVNELGQVTDGVFQTLLTEADKSPRAMALKAKLATVDGGIDHGESE